MILTIAHNVIFPISVIVKRGWIRMVRRYANMFPLVVMPLFFLIAFAGSFSGLGRLEGFGTDNVIDWMLPWAALQGCAFAGIGTGAFTAEDLEGGFYDRLFLAPITRPVLLAGLLAFAGARSLIPLTLVSIVAKFLGASYPTGVAGVGMLYIAGVSIAFIMALLSLALVYHFKVQRILALGQIVIFVALFLSIGQAPIRFMQGWLPYVARVNPFTNIIRFARQGLIGDITWADTWPGLLAISGLVLSFGFFALRNLFRYNR